MNECTVSNMKKNLKDRIYDCDMDFQYEDRKEFYFCCGYFVTNALANYPMTQSMKEGIINNVKRFKNEEMMKKNLLSFAKKYYLKNGKFDDKISNRLLAGITAWKPEGYDSEDGEYFMVGLVAERYL